MQLTRVSALVLLAVVAGCSFAPIDGGVQNVCGGTDECTGSATCDMDRGLCVSNAVESLELALELIPATDPGTDRPNFITAPFEVTGPATRDLQIPSWVEVSGQVRRGDQRVAADLIFTRPGLPGRPVVRVRTTTLNEPLVADGNESDYVVRLEPGQLYDVEVKPRADTMPGSDTPWLRALPPMRFIGVVQTPEAEGATTIRWRAMFPFPDTLDRVCETGVLSGCSLNGAVVSMVDGEPFGQAGLQVRAVAPDGSTVSSTALTEEDGGFLLKVSPNTESYILRVTGGADRPLFPVVDADPAFLSADLRIRVPEPRVIRYIGRVEGPGNRGVASATLAFESSDIGDDGDGVQGSFRSTVTADDEGAFDVELLAGTYDVVITPADLDLAVSTETVGIVPPTSGDTLRGQLFALPRRARLGGSVTAPDMREMPGVAIEAVAADAPMTIVPEARHNRSSEALTFETGQFDLPLDVGAYDLFLRPPASSGFAWVVAPELVVGSVDSTLVARYQVDAPVPLAGDVTGPEGAAVVGGEVRAYAMDDGRFVEVGRARVDELGHYEMLLPPRFMRP